MKTVHGFTTFAAVAAISAAAHGQCPGEGDCCAANGTPGCDDAECCEAICIDDAFCCDTEWDESCAELALAMCESCAAPGLEASLDIKPGSCPNSWNPRSRGKLSVALLGTDTFDVAMVDLESLQLGRADGEGETVAPMMGPRGPRPKIKDAATPFVGEACGCHELEEDGMLDLKLKFKSQHLAEAMALDVPHGTMVELVLSGQLLDGTPFTARDCVRIVGRQRSKMSD